MTAIAPVTDVDPFFIGERPSYNKFLGEVTTKTNTLITNSVLMANAINQLIQGAEGGAEQAKIPFSLATAPEGWTRDATFLDDHLMRVTDGVTVPDGADPTVVGGDHGGDWTITSITSIAALAHVHTQSHTHDIAHYHTTTTHSHPMSHSHTLPSHTHDIPNTALQLPADMFSYAVISAASGTNYAYRTHTHQLVAHNHGGTSTGSGDSTWTQSNSYTGTSTPSSSTLAASSGNASTTDTGSSGGHAHAISANGAWRPKYQNLIVCKRD